MGLRALNSRQAQALFAASFITIYTAIFLISRAHQATRVSTAAIFDLTITTAAVFYFLLVRRGHAGWISLATIALIGLRTATFLFPATPSAMKWIAVPLELLVIVNIVRRIRRVPEGDALIRIRAATTAVIPNTRASRIVAAELAVLYYAFCSWRSRPDTGFSCARSSGYDLFGTLLIFGMIFEGIPLHLLVTHYSQPIAWILTAFDLYGLLWATAILRANRLRAIQVNDETLHIRVGLLWEMEIARRDITGIRPYVATDKPDLKALFLNTPILLLELARPVPAIGLYGNTRLVKRLAICVDSPDEFVAAVCDSLWNV